MIRSSGELTRLATCSELAPGYATKISPDEDIDNVIKLAEQKMYHEKLLEGKVMRNDLVKALEKRTIEQKHKH